MTDLTATPDRSLLQAFAPNTSPSGDADGLEIDALDEGGRPASARRHHVTDMQQWIDLSA